MCYENYCNIVLYVGVYYFIIDISLFLDREVILALRKTTSLTKLVYVSCEPQSAIKNFVE